MKVKTFDSIDEVHKIWNDETWIRYNEIESALPSGVYLTEEQEEQLFPSMPDYIVIDNTVYKPEVSEHLERYGRKVDGCSFYRVELIKVTDPEITDQILNTPEKMTEQLRERLEKKYPTLTELGLRFEIKLNFIHKASEIQLVREDGKILALQWDYSSTEAEMDKWLYEASKSFEFMNQVNHLINEESISITDELQYYSTYWSVKGTYQYGDNEYSFELRKFKEYTQLYLYHTHKAGLNTLIELNDHISITCKSNDFITLVIENCQKITLDTPLLETIRNMVDELKPIEEMIC